MRHRCDSAPGRDRWCRRNGCRLVGLRLAAEQMLQLLQLTQCGRLQLLVVSDTGGRAARCRSADVATAAATAAADWAADAGLQLMSPDPASEQRILNERWCVTDKRDHTDQTNAVPYF